MRALTVRQPWAWAIMHGKDVENRSRNIAGDYRGPVAITAAVADADNAPDGLWVDHANFYDRAHGPMFKGPKTERGVVLGVVDLVAVHHASWNPMRPGLCYYLEPEGRYGERCSPWAQPEDWHLMLANPRPLPTPIPVRGRLGLWTLPDDVAAQVEEALR